MRASRPSRASAPRWRSRRSARGRSPSSASSRCCSCCAIVLGRARGARRPVLRARAVRRVALLDRAVRHARVDRARPALSAAAIAAFGAVAVIVRRPEAVRSSNALAIAAAWTVLDWIRGCWPFGGFTWVSLGVSQVANRTLLPLAGITARLGRHLRRRARERGHRHAADRPRGEGSASGRARRPRRDDRGRWRPCCCPAAVIDGPSADPSPSSRSTSGCRPGVSTVEEDLLVARRNIEAHRIPRQRPGRRPRGVGRGSARPRARSQDPATVAATQAAIAAVGVPTTVGAVVNDPDGIAAHERARLRRHRASWWIATTRCTSSRSGSTCRFGAGLTWIDAIGQIPVDRVPGESLHTIAQPGIPPYGTPICFENAFPSIPRDLRARRRGRSSWCRSTTPPTCSRRPPRSTSR